MTDELEQLHNLELLLASEVLKICEKFKNRDASRNFSRGYTP